MYLELLIENLMNPALLFFIFGILAVKFKSDLEIPESSSKFISIYLLLSIGFNGGQELVHNSFNLSILSTMIYSILISLITPIGVFFTTKKKLGVENAGAIAASYGSVSAVTFITAISFLEISKIPFGGYMVACLALMEAPAIVMGVLMSKLYSVKKKSMDILNLVKHSFTNGSVFLIMISLIIGSLATDQQAMDIKPFTTDIFKGFLSIFLLDMGITCGKRLKPFFKNGWYTTVSAIVFSLVGGIVTSYLTSFFIPGIGDRFLMTILAASASYIAVPAAMKIAIPKANPGLYLPMALGVSFPFNITLGFPIYYYLCTIF